MSPIDTPDALTAYEQVTDELDRRFFRDRYDTATEAERIYMAAMADLGPGGHGSSEIAARMGLTVKTASVRRDGLLKKGLIYSRVDTELDFTVPQFATFDPADPPIRRDTAPAARTPTPSSACAGPRAGEMRSSGRTHRSRRAPVAPDRLTPMRGEARQASLTARANGASFFAYGAEPSQARPTIEQMSFQAVSIAMRPVASPCANLDSLDDDSQAAIEHQIGRLNLLSDAKPYLPCPHSSQVDGELRELRCHYGRDLYRILYRRSEGLVISLAYLRQTLGLSNSRPRQPCRQTRSPVRDGPAPTTRASAHGRIERSILSYQVRSPVGGAGGSR